ncbi:MAG TPA: 5-oxoprolinase, partial [Gammaproteobacteria bacterium]|nr:5-oxoprolinase [Gammaproteobacteria bacterium]
MDDAQQWQFWVDRGGTFTDIVAKHPDGRLLTHKLLSDNPERYSDAAVQGIRDLLKLPATVPIPAERINHVKMGTTVATNALLERTGDRTLLVTTRGFGDALRIGYQSRPYLFDLHITLPELLYERVIEVNERVGARGEVVSALDAPPVRSAMQVAFSEGIRAVAIVLMHGYRFPAHERRIAQIAGEIGFTQISVSHRVSPLMKLIARGDTTVVDAYLSPLLRRYVEQVAGELSCDTETRPLLMFMQSNGGLTNADLFQGKDAILSGPAGGVVGMTRTAAMIGCTKLIGFDMGGTSTDVTHYDGEFERSFETEVAGVRMRAPMMHIHTVAAGGGSILRFDGARFKVGPESAGANPGPACYRRGGPLTVTDCNVLLGKLQPKYFPKAFGPDGNQAIDDGVVRRKFMQLSASISAATGETVKSPEALAEGFLRIAVENMANAIKKISVQRGYHLRGYTLNCFGGAAGQHACLVADALGMDQIFLHPFAGVLSAYGMGLADIRAMREAQVEVGFNVEAEKVIREACSDLIVDGTVEVSNQGVSAEHISVVCKAHIRYEGTDTSILVDVADVDGMRTAFERSHRQRFGFIVRQRKLVIEAVSVEIIGRVEPFVDPEFECAELNAPQPIDRISIAEISRDVPLYDRDRLLPGHSIDGPATIIEATGTIMVEEGWRARVNSHRHLILKRFMPRPLREAIGSKADPVMLEVFNNLFMSIADQMGATLANTAYSVNIKERLDFSCAVFDAHGNLVANAPHVPVHLGSMSETVKAIIDANKGHIRAGDVFAHNAPYNGGTHLPDLTVITPVYDDTETEILFYVGSRGHHADIGGRTPGSAPPDSRHIEDEGVLVDNFRVVERGELRDAATRALFMSGPFPCRNVDQNMADLTAQIAANKTGARELSKMVGQFGLEVVHAYMTHVQDNAEESVRRVLDVLKEGTFNYPMENGSSIRVSIEVDKTTRSAIIDFTGTSSQDSGNYNAPLAVVRAAVLYVFRTLTDESIPLNEGCMKPLTIRVPPRTLLSPEYPAA